MAIVNGTPQNDILYGTLGSDTIQGFDGNDYIDGRSIATGGQFDVIDAGAGDDTIVFDFYLEAANVQGGTGTDTLLVIGGNVPTDFDLIAAGIEKAVWIDPLPVNGQLARTTYTNYNSSWEIISSRVYEADGRTQEVLYDFEGRDWNIQYLYYDRQGNLVGSYVFYDDGRLLRSNRTGLQADKYDFEYFSAPGVRAAYMEHTEISTRYVVSDLPGAANYWSSIYQEFNLNDELSLVIYTWDNGQRSYTTFDDTDIADWTSIRQEYDAQFRYTEIAITYDDGRVIDTLFDVTGAATYWSTLTQIFNAAGQKTEYTYIWDNGRISDTAIDATDLYDWTTLHQNYDAARVRTDYTYVYDDDTKKTVIIDVEDRYAWTTQTTFFDATGGVTDIFYN